MTREDGERRVRDWWSHASQAGTGCEMRIEPSLTEEYEWGWVVSIGPARRAELRRPYLYERYACERHGGRSIPEGTKGLEDALKRLGVVRDADWAGLSPAERDALWGRLTKFTRDEPPVRPWDDPHDTMVLTVAEVASGARPVLLIVRDGALDGGGIGGWQFFDEGGPREESLVAVAKFDLLALDPTLAEVTDLPVGWRASRPSHGRAWHRERS